MKSHEFEILKNAKAVAAQYQNDPTAQDIVTHHSAIIKK